MQRLLSPTDTSEGRGDFSSTRAWGLTRIQEIRLMQGCSSDFGSASLFHHFFFLFLCVCVFFSCSCLGLFPFSSFSFIFLFSCNIGKENSWPITNVIPLSSHNKTNYKASRITSGFHCHYSKTNINLPSVTEAKNQKHTRANYTLTHVSNDTSNLIKFWHVPS